MQKNYDVIVVGAGPAGIMTCYELYLKDPSKKVLLIDKGHDVMYRHCPIKDKKIKSCPVIKDNEPGVYQLVLLLRDLVVQVLIPMVSLILQVSLVVG